MKSILPLLVVLVLLSGCGRDEPEILERKFLFQLSLGKMEDQIDLFQKEGTPFEEKTRIFMRGGTFFISNSNSAKVMQFSSYGDLTRMFYNIEKNPEPVILNKHSEGSTVKNKTAFPYPFVSNGAICVNNKMNIFVEDQIGRDRGVVDEETGTLFQYVVLRFDNNGRYLEYIGQEGIGGTPFPYIENVYITNNDDIVVVARTIVDWRVYWFNDKGSLVSRDVFPLENLPGIENESAIPALENILPDSNEHRLHVKINYFRDAVDQETGARYGIDSTISRIYWYLPEKQSYQGFVTIPENIKEYRGDGAQESQQIAFQYEFIASVGDGYYFLLSRELNNQYQLMIMNETGKVLQRKYIYIEDDELIYRTFQVSPEGILTALLGKEYGAELVWWRTDSLVGSPFQ